MHDFLRRRNYLLGEDRIEGDEGRGQGAKDHTGHRKSANGALLRFFFC